MVKRFWAFLTKQRNMTGWPTVASLLLLGFFVVGAFLPRSTSHPDAWVVQRSVMLFSPTGQCSGEQVRAPSGRDYILSAGHCHDIADENENILVKLESGQIIMRRVIAEDPLSDLLLIEGVPNLEGLPIADSIRRFQHINTFTHGKGLMTYKTEGTLIQTLTIEIPLWIGPSGKSEQIPSVCFLPKMKIVQEDNFLFGEITACLLSVTEVVTTAKIVPGSSGGMIVDERGSLVGVASATDQYGFGYIVRLSDIKRFVGGY